MKKINRKKRGKIENSIFPLFFWNVEKITGYRKTKEKKKQDTVVKNI